MTTAAELLLQGRRDEVWAKYCGFLDLTLSEFMEIQERLLMEQIGRLGRCDIGLRLLGRPVPASVEEFHARVPLTTYKDYEPFLSQQRDEGLPSQPQLWARTSGRGTEYRCKWAPYSAEGVRKVGEFAVAAFLLASCSGRGDVRLEPDDVCLYTLAPPPYFTGAAVARGLSEQLNPTFIPALDRGEQMDFQERIGEGFRLALKTGIDLFYGLSSVLVAVAEQFQRGSGGFRFSSDMLDPRLLVRVLRGVARSRVRGNGLLPRDLWKVKGIVAGGMDTAFYSSLIEAYWGRKPLEGYGGTELGGVALQAWNYRGMTFLPDSNYLEFIAQEDFYRSQADPTYRPAALRLDEVGPGVYELVVTNFHGGVFTRYRTGDLVEIVSLGDTQLGVSIPQVVFHARADGVIDVGGFTRLTEKAVWQAIEEAGVRYKGWTMRKEYSAGKPLLHLYLELGDGADGNDVRAVVHERLEEIDSGYAELGSMLGIDPLRVTVLRPGAFDLYSQGMAAAGADLAHLKPPRVNPSDETVERLLSQ